jgi:hypothetical protein
LRFQAILAQESLRQNAFFYIDNALCDRFSRMPEAIHILLPVSVELLQQPRALCEA